MNESDLAALVHQPESDGLERKEAFNDRVREAICALANDLPNNRRPGIVVIGQRDDGTCAGLTVTDLLLQQVANVRIEGTISPPPAIDVKRLAVDGCDLVVVVVHPSTSPPVSFRGRIYVRVGPTRRFATREEELRLAEKRRWAALPYDVHAVESATVDDLDLELFASSYLPSAVAPDVLAQNERTKEERLTALRLLSPNGCPSVVGILSIGKDPRRFLPGAYIQFLRIDGVDLTDPISDQKEIDGPLPQMLRRVDDLIDANNRTSLSIVGSPTHTPSPEYPPDALRQLVRNAVMHRSYEGTAAPVRMTWFVDRIEIQNPGGPYGQVTVENFGTPGLVDYRNPHVADALKTFGFVERFGVGIPIAKKALRQNQNPDLEIEPDPSHVLVRVRRRAS